MVLEKIWFRVRAVFVWSLTNPVVTFTFTFAVMSFLLLLLPCYCYNFCARLSRNTHSTQNKAKKWNNHVTWIILLNSLPPAIIIRNNSNHSSHNKKCLTALIDVNNAAAQPAAMLLILPHGSLTPPMKITTTTLDDKSEDSNPIIWEDDAGTDLRLLLSRSGGDYNSPESGGSCYQLWRSRWMRWCLA